MFSDDDDDDDEDEDETPAQSAPVAAAAQPVVQAAQPVVQAAPAVQNQVIAQTPVQGDVYKRQLQYYKVSLSITRNIYTTEAREELINV